MSGPRRKSKGCLGRSPKDNRTVFLLNFTEKQPGFMGTSCILCIRGCIIPVFGIQVDEGIWKAGVLFLSAGVLTTDGKVQNLPVSAKSWVVLGKVPFKAATFTVLESEAFFWELEGLCAVHV